MKRFKVIFKVKEAKDFTLTQQTKLQGYFYSLLDLLLWQKSSSAIVWFHVHFRPWLHHTDTEGDRDCVGPVKEYSCHSVSVAVMKHPDQSQHR